MMRFEAVHKKGGHDYHLRGGGVQPMREVRRKYLLIRKPVACLRQSIFARA
jgi:hypothetical protein